MKKIKLVLFVILLLSVFILSGCCSVTVNAKEENYKAILLLPDGTVVRGTCTDYQRVSVNWLVVTVDGISYRLNDWRAVIIEEKVTK